MKKDRNTFFEGSSYFAQANMPNPNMNIANAPFQTSSQSSFYAGPATPMNYNVPSNMNANMTDYNDIESRLSKLERQINRIDARITKLENMNLYQTEEIDNTTNMYMV